MDSNINSICMTTSEYLRIQRLKEKEALLSRIQLIGARPDLADDLNKLKVLLNE